MLDAETLRDLIGRPPDSALVETKQIGFNATGATVQSWRADADYLLTSATLTGAVIINLVGATYAQLSGAGTHLDWIALNVSAATTEISHVALRRIIKEGQLLYSSHGGSASACLISLQLLKKPEISTEK
jgi:hypothetical protein